MTITNFKKLAKTPLRKKALLIAEAGYKAIEIKNAVKNLIKLKNSHLEVGHKGLKPFKIDLKKFNRIFIVGIGKGSALASMTLAKILGKKLTGGIALDVDSSRFKIQDSKFKIFKGTHPFPSRQNIKATKKIIKLAKSLKKNDLLINFICGGGSALACSSESELKESTFATKELTKAGAAISELNIIRRHLSEIKGGGLAKFAYPATIVSLIVSDVCGNDLLTVASGPTVYDKTSRKDAEKVLNKYFSRRSAFYSALVRALKETSKDRKYFKKVKNILFVCNQDAVYAMAEKARQMKLKTKINSLVLEGEAETAFISMVGKIKRKEAILAAGETTVTFRRILEPGIKHEPGKGGRNMESVLGAMALVPGDKFVKGDLIVISFASDGHDNTEAAGAIGDALIIKNAKTAGLNLKLHLKNHDTFNFFKKTGGLIFASKKAFNVADLMIVVRE